jgi:two-component system, chemotaxis family, CheB/CheR fusion protein
MKRKKEDNSSTPPPTAPGAEQQPASSESARPSAKKTNGFPIVGIGASAGGLEAVEQFLLNLPADTGMAFVLVSHLDPHHKSILAELLSRQTPLQVLQAQNGTKVAPNHFYVIPPNCYLSIEGGVLQLTEFEETRALRMPIDHFLRSLAEDQKENAIAVILSGNGTDGSLGVRAVNGSGGVALVQNPATAKFDGMPRSGVATGLADFVLSPAEMPEHLIEYLQHFEATRSGTPVATPVSPAKRSLSPIERIHALLRARTGNDFSGYKKSTIARRIDRRMSIHRLDDPSDYTRLLEQNPDEITILFRELLIGVTSFFRDPEAFDVLKKKILPRLLDDRADHSPVRVWTPGCASGEETYSIAIVLNEYMAEYHRTFHVQVFGTDLDPHAIAAARQGWFPANIALDVTSERLARFFDKDDAGYQIKKTIREQVVFAQHNVVQDAPFAKLDLLSCRNLLIYLEIELQKRLLPILHFALAPGGFLFLGPSESIGEQMDLFLAVDKKWKFFQRRDGRNNRRPLAVPIRPRIHAPPEQEKRAASTSFEDHDVLVETKKMLLERFSPPCVVTTEKGDVLYIHGQIGKYLEPAPGRMSTNILDMVRDSLRFDLHAALTRASAGQREHISRSVALKNDGEIRQLVRVSARPFSQGLIWVVFEDVEAAEATQAPGKAGKHGASSREAELQQELTRTHDSLQTTIEELQAANEELRSANEELQSINEEHQSTNEELETSKEELQSLNEELLTLNSELSAKVEQANKVESDLKNLLDSLNVGVIFLDIEMRIVRYTPEATVLVKLIPGDIGRPIEDLVSSAPELAKNARAVLDKLVPREMEVQKEDGSWFLARITPYRTLDNVIGGVVLTFYDITTGKLKDEAARRYVENILQTVRQPFLVLDPELRVRSVNAAFCDLFNVSAESTIGEKIYHLGNHQWDIPRLRELLGLVLERNSDVKDFLVEHTFPGIGHRKMLLNAHLVQQDRPHPDAIFLAIEDIGGDGGGTPP